MVKEKTTKWNAAYQELKGKIESGGYKKGDRFLSTAEVCEKYNVSYMTGRKVLSELALDNLNVRKPKVGSVIKSTVNEIYVFVPDFIQQGGMGTPGGFVFAKMLKGVIAEAQSHGIGVEYINERSLREKAKQHYILVSPTYMTGMEDMFADSSKIVIMHAPERHVNFHTVRHGLYEGAYMATEYLLKKGYERVGFISGPLEDIPWYLPRFEGYFDALKDNGVAFDLRYVVETPATGKDMSREDNKDAEAFASLFNLPQCPDAVFCANDDRALNILDYCAKHDIKVPGEMAVCGLDNRHESSLSSPPLTTIDTHLKKVGEEGVKLAIKAEEGRFSEAQDVLVRPEIIERGTA